MSENTDALKLAEAIVDRLFEAHEFIDSIYLDREMIHVGVARWTGRNGVTKYHRRLDKKRFGQRMPSLPGKTDHHAIIINERILEQGNRAEFIDTTQHELAHALCVAKYAKYPSRKRDPDYAPRFSSHGPAWKEVARKLGADPKACHNKRDRSDEYEYFITCPECDMEDGKTKRSKVIKRPFDRKCGKCGHHPLSSYEDGQKPPEESGVVNVESLTWNNRKEWIRQGRP